MALFQKGDISGCRMTEQVELFNVIKEPDGIGGLIEQRTSLGIFDVEVSELGGGRLGYYLQLGFTHPVIITMYKPDVEFNNIAWRGKMLKIDNIKPDSRNWKMIRITADYTDGKV